MRRCISTTITLAALFMAGCGTLSNWVSLPTKPGGEPVPAAPFGGVARDSDEIKEAWAHTRWGGNTGGPNQFPIARALEDSLVVVLTPGLYDFPFSLVGDVVTLPLVECYRMGTTKIVD